jgi:RsiW-degrading membrane proteinase PrsW (M82 family)
MEQVHVSHQPKRLNSWWRVLLTGLLFYLIGLITLVLTSNPNLFPTVVMIGNFLIPITYVTFFYERRHQSRLTLPDLAKGFVYGGFLGVIAASILEPLFIRRLDFLTAFGVGLIEEFAKILGILVIARHHSHDDEMEGIILGAAAGMGFAALESNGYVFSAFLRSGGSLSLTVGVTLVRGVLSPVGHGTWTAILAGILYRESRAGRFRFNLKVIGAYLLVSILHGLWDGLPTFISIVLSPGLDVFIGQTIVGASGLLILWLIWRQAKRRQAVKTAADLMTKEATWTEIESSESSGLETKAKE